MTDSSQTETPTDDVSPPQSGLQSENVDGPQASHEGDLSGVIVLPELLDVAAVVDLHLDTMAAHAEEKMLRFDGAGVRKMSTAGVQFLLAAENLQRKNGQKLALINPSQDLITAFADMNLAQRLEKWNDHYGS